VIGLEGRQPKGREERTMRYEKLSRMAGLLSAALVAIVTLAVAAQAFQTTTTPNTAFLVYNLAAGASSGGVTPPANIPTLVMGEQTTTGNVGSSDMTVVNSVGHDNELVWSGLESNGGGPTAGFSPVPGTHIIFIDFAHCVDIEVNNATSFKVHNKCSSAQTGIVTEIW
jgi:hypothetical protein